MLGGGEPVRRSVVRVSSHTKFPHKPDPVDKHVEIPTEPSETRGTRNLVQILTVPKTAKARGQIMGRVHPFADTELKLESLRAPNRLEMAALHVKRHMVLMLTGPILTRRRRVRAYRRVRPARRAKVNGLVGEPVLQHAMEASRLKRTTSKRRRLSERTELVVLRVHMQMVQHSNNRVINKLVAHLQQPERGKNTARSVVQEIPVESQNRITREI